MKDLEQLCLKLINSQITGIKNSAPTFDDNQAYYASYGKAEIIYQKIVYSEIFGFHFLFSFRIRAIIYDKIIPYGGLPMKTLHGLDYSLKIKIQLSITLIKLRKILL